MKMTMTAENIGEAITSACNAGKRLEITDGECPGLELGIAPTGVASWSLRVRDNFGRLRRFPVGKYPDLKAKAAQKMARDLRGKVEAGADPIAAKRVLRQIGADLGAGIGTLEWLLNLYEKKGEPPSSWFTPTGRKRVTRIFRRLLDSDIKTLTVAKVLTALDDYSGTRRAVENGIRALRPVLTWAIPRGHASPELLTLKPGRGVPKRRRYLDDAELARILPVLLTWRTDHGPAMAFMLMTLARRGEVEGARWLEFDLDAAAWIIPPERQKNTKPDQERRPLLVPLSRQTVILLRRHETRGRSPDQLVFRGRRGAKLGNWDRVQKAIHKASGTSGWHRHDLRRTGATLMGELGIDPHVVSSVQNHITIHTELSSRYNQSRYHQQVTEAMSVLGRKLLNLCGRFVVRADENGEPEQVWIRDMWLATVIHGDNTATVQDRL